ncbi:MAG: polynucleotide adenylyltransferase PcnB [Pseudomonadota bacterium]|nr:polynucleotide adenylyltransferase PcnB [Pseudomonadota bacterium]
MNNSESQPRPGPRIIPRSEHNISRANISDNALRVLYRLKKAGYGAFLVGGGVRDLLLDRRPKDFDIVTDAHPEQVRKLFRYCRLVGRRFRLAHVRFGREVIEVATFRASATDKHKDRIHTKKGRIIRDNVYGNIDEDVWRRDFTANALYYNIADFTIWDYCSGISDIKSGILRLIGDPVTRYKEDPVRMLRAVRLAAKLDLTIAPNAEAPILELGELLNEVPAARLYDELIKLFHAGHATRSFDLLIRYNLFQYLLPVVDRYSQGSRSRKAFKFIHEGLQDTDDRVRADRPVTPAFLFAVFLWYPVLDLAGKLVQEGRSEAQAMLDASSLVISEQQSRVSLPRRFWVPIKDIYLMQRRFMSRRGVRSARLLYHRRFRAGYDFLLLRSKHGEVGREIADWWTDVQRLEPEAQKKAFFIKGRRRK